MISFCRKAMIAGLLALSSFSTLAAIDAYEFESDEQAQAFKELTLQLRCPKCQNNSIADSNAPIATDMRTKVYDMMKQGYSNQQIIDYMIDRYGHFVTYNPPVNATTIVLWAGPVIFLLLGAGAVVMLSRRRNGAAEERDTLSEQEAVRLKQLLDDEQRDIKNKGGKAS